MQDSMKMIALTLMVGAVFSMGCSKSLQAQAGSKSVEESSRMPMAEQSGQPVMNDLAAAPSLSVSGENAVRPSLDGPEDIVIARAEPSPEARQRLEEVRQQQHATAAAGLRDVYFDFDRWTLNDEGRHALQADAEWLRLNPEKRLTIQGHCDERGTSSYNLVLGEKRARAIRQYLVDLGIQANRLVVVSMGKEQPFCQEQSETCYQQNRRGHLVVNAESSSHHTN